MSMIKQLVAGAIAPRAKSDRFLGIDFAEYSATSAVHGEPVQSGGRLLFSDGFSYSVPTIAAQNIRRLRTPKNFLLSKLPTGGRGLRLSENFSLSTPSGFAGLKSFRRRKSKPGKPASGSLGCCPTPTNLRLNLKTWTQFERRRKMPIVIELPEEFIARHRGDTFAGQKVRTGTGQWLLADGANIQQMGTNTPLHVEPPTGVRELLELRQVPFGAGRPF